MPRAPGLPTRGLQGPLPSLLPWHSGLNSEPPWGPSCPRVALAHAQALQAAWVRLLLSAPQGTPREEQQGASVEGAPPPQAS